MSLGAGDVVGQFRTDKPVDAVAGEWALRIVIFVGGAGGMWLLSKLPKIWELLGG